MGIRDFLGMTRPTLGFEAQSTSMNEGSAPVEQSESNANMNSDRQQKVLISRDKNGCEWAYENDVAVYNAIQKKVYLKNTGFEIIINPKYKNDKKAEEAKEKLEKKVIYDWDLDGKMKFITEQKSIHSWAVLRCITSSKGEVIKIMPLSSKECNPLRDINTGELGVSYEELSTGIGTSAKINVGNEKKRVAVIQEGYAVTYDNTGAQVAGGVVFYGFSPDEVIVFPSNDRGKMTGTSDLMRCLRLVETKMSVQNMIELVVRRFGPQVWVEVGNENVNLTNVQIPQKYLRNTTTGAPIDIQTARDQYRADMFSGIKTQLQKWNNGETLMHIAEYGINPKIITPSGAIINYDRYVSLFGELIKIGMLGMDFPGRVDVTSQSMIEDLSRDVRDKIKYERKTDELVFDLRMSMPTLKAWGYDEDMCFIRYKKLEEKEEERRVMLEFRKSQTIFNYLRAGAKIPDHLLEEWELDESINKIPKTPTPAGGTPGQVPGSPAGKSMGKPAGIQYAERAETKKEEGFHGNDGKK